MQKYNFFFIQTPIVDNYFAIYFFIRIFAPKNKPKNLYHDEETYPPAGFAAGFWLRFRTEGGKQKHPNWLHHTSGIHCHHREECRPGERRHGATPRRRQTKKSEGFVVAFSQRFSEIDTEPINFYTKVEKAGKNKTQVTVCAIPTDLSADQKELQNNLHNFLSNFVQYVNKFEARNNMEVEQGNLKKAQKKHASAVSVVEKLDKSIKNDQEKIADKKKDIEKYKQKIIECQEDIKNLEANIVKSQEQKTSAQKDVEKANDNVRNVEAQVEKYRSLAE